MIPDRGDGSKRRDAFRHYRCGARLGLRRIGSACRKGISATPTCCIHGRRVDQWGPGSGTGREPAGDKLYFYFLARSFIDAGFEAIHYAQVEIMNGNDPDLSNWSQVFTLALAYAATHARRHMLICDAHVPHGGLVRDGHLLLDFHAFPLRIMEVPDTPQEAILKVGFSDGIYNRSRGGSRFSLRLPHSLTL